MVKRAWMVLAASISQWNRCVNTSLRPKVREITTCEKESFWTTPHVICVLDQLVKLTWKKRRIESQEHSSTTVIWESRKKVTNTVVGTAHHVLRKRPWGKLMPPRIFTGGLPVDELVELLVSVCRKSWMGCLYTTKPCLLICSCVYWHQLVNTCIFATGGSDVRMWGHLIH